MARDDVFPTGRAEYSGHKLFTLTETLLPSSLPLMTTDGVTPTLLFTAFEPSGDDHAAAVIRELRRRHPNLPIYAWGGPKMARAGATIICETGQDAVVGVPGWDKIRQHQRINKDIARWIATNRATVHIPVDSPAANFPICKIAKKSGLKVCHLVAPQVWAWGGWRIRKLRRRTDLVLCLLPFEERWFTRGRWKTILVIGLGLIGLLALYNLFFLVLLVISPEGREDLTLSTGIIVPDAGGGSPRTFTV